jgi:hypothetical protein
MLKLLPAFLELNVLKDLTCTDSQRKIPSLPIDKRNDLQNGSARRRVFVASQRDGQYNTENHHSTKNYSTCQHHVSGN